MAKALNITPEMSAQFAAELDEIGETPEFKKWLEDQPMGQSVEEMLEWEPVEETEKDIPEREEFVGMKALVIELANEDDIEVKGIVITPGGRVGDNSSHNFSPKENWVDKRGGLPKYIRTVRNALVREGHSESKATAMAIAAIKRWARGANHVSEEVQAAAVKALAEWEAMKGTKSFDDDMETKQYDSEHGQPKRGAPKPAANNKPPQPKKTFGNSHGNQPNRHPQSGKPPQQQQQQRSQRKLKQDNNPEFNKKHPRDQFGKFAAIQAGDGVNKKADEEKRKKIMDVQRALIEMGLLDKNSGANGGNGVDGAFGPKTLAAVKLWQQKNGMKPDGLLSSEMINKLRVDKKTKGTKAKKGRAGKTTGGSGGRSSGGSSGGSSRGGSSGGSSRGGSSGGSSSGGGSSRRTAKKTTGSSAKKTSGRDLAVADENGNVTTSSSSAKKTAAKRVGKKTTGTRKTTGARKPKGRPDAKPDSKYKSLLVKGRPVTDKDRMDDKGKVRSRTQYNFDQAVTERALAEAEYVDMKKRGSDKQIAQAKKRVASAVNRWERTNTALKRAQERDKLRAKKKAEREKAKKDKLAKMTADQRKKAQEHEAERARIAKEVQSVYDRLDQMFKQK